MNIVKAGLLTTEINAGKAVRRFVRPLRRRRGGVPLPPRLLPAEK
eukprot:gene9753-22222_t